MRRFAVLSALALGLLAGCGNDEPVMQTDIPFRPDGILEVLRADGGVITTLVIEIAEGDSARQRGLMQRRSLPARGGMLFLDDEVKIQGFWMKNTPLPLDIIFIGADSSIINIAERTLSFSESTWYSSAPAQYVLEVRAGFTARNGIDSTASVRWRRVPPDQQ